ncbi:insulin-like growth factor 3 [Salminus brasiliensis]|uniref:insulin-like growth factor 3 n=1 Tax=Salminus brasiliensis TaxID=930266 RepID=UPI003B837A91
MAHNEGYILSAAGSMLQVLCWRSVCVFCALLCVAVLPELGDAATQRCGTELIADLEFVCGDRGFYRGRVGGARNGGPRSRGKGIVEQCCIKGCDLQHLEKYCAKPKRGRRHAPTAQQMTEELFQRVLLKRYYRLQHDVLQLTNRLEERTLYQEKYRNSFSHQSPEESHKSAHSKPQHGDRESALRTFTPHSLPS